MKTRIAPTLLPLFCVGMITLFAGCEAESETAPKADTAAPAATADAAPSQTNVGIAPAVPKIITAPKLAEGVEEIVQLAQAGVGDEVLLAYIENSRTPYKLDVDQILYLHDLGVSAEVIAAMVRQGEALREQPATIAETDTKSIAASATLNPTETPETIPTAVPAYTEISAAADDSAQVPQQVTHNYFYSALSPYGNWVEVPDYGWCWQPSVAVINTSWQPYSDRGRWLNTDYGWYWQSDYSWGWAPFHYGRWYRSPACGWVWAPDNVWGPAWVTWRYSNAYCGWAPLPPGAYFDAGFGFRFRGAHVGFGFDFGLSSDCYTFLPLGLVGHRTPWHHRLPHSRIRTVINNTTIVNNYNTGPGNMIVNIGPGTRGIAAASRQEIRKVSLRDVNPASGTPVKADRLDRDGATLAVFRPNLPKQAATPPREITQRQQESRKRSEVLANSDVVKLGAANREQKTLIPSQPRNSGVATSPRAGTPVAPKVVGSVNDRRSSRSESSGVVSTEPPRKSGESVARVPGSATGNAVRESRNSQRSVTSAPELVKPLESPRRPAPGIAQQPPNSVFRSESATRQPASRPNLNSPSPSRPPQSFGRPDPNPRPANPPSFRSETRQSPTPGYALTPPRGSSSSQPSPAVVQPQPVAPRPNPPVYQPPQRSAPPAYRSEPVRIQPAQPSRPQPAPSFTPSPAPSRSQSSISAPSAPSRPQPSPPRSQPSPSSSSRGDGGRKER